MTTKAENWCAKVLDAPVPTWFKARLTDAYYWKFTPRSHCVSCAGAGCELARHIESYASKEQLEQLRETDLSERAIARWLRTNLAHFYELVPPRCRPGFVRGFMAFLEEH